MALLDDLLNLVVGLTKPFAKGANIFAKGYGDLHRGISGNTGYTSPLEEYIRGGITDEEYQGILDNPYMESAKSGAGMASALIPLTTGVGATAFSQNPLINKTLQYGIGGGLPGALSGFSYSPEGEELKNTLMGGGAGAGAGILGGYLLDSGYRQLMNEATTGQSSGGMYPAALDLSEVGGGLGQSGPLRTISSKEAARKAVRAENQGIQIRFGGGNTIQIGDAVYKIRPGSPKVAPTSNPLKTITSKEAAQKAVKAVNRSGYRDFGWGPDDTFFSGPDTFRVLRPTKGL